ncbi:DUF309 domain-containing protein [Nitratireductor mangrovi]|nr:DUF309 domain-containing protein [Nitratireductor mangrovi]
MPGTTARPEQGLFMEIAERAPEVTDPAQWSDNEAWRYGFALYGHGFFWEAHEVWEPVWMGLRPNSAERMLVQGLIQLANCCLKLRMGRPRAAGRLANHAADCLWNARHGREKYAMGVDVAQAADDALRFAQAIEAGERVATDADVLVAQRPALVCENAL